MSLDGFVAGPDHAMDWMLLGDGIRLFDNPGGVPARLELINSVDPTTMVNLRYWPARPA